MPQHSFLRPIRHGVSLLSLLFPAFSYGDLTSSCTGDFPNVIRAELNSNFWASNSSLSSQRGIFLWVGQQNWDTAHNNQTQPFPLLTVLSTVYNDTYISTSPDGSQDQPCPESYTYNSDWDMDTDYWTSDEYFTYNPSMTCHGYYDLSTSLPFAYQTPSNFTGSPESASITNSLSSQSPKYAITTLSLVEPETYLNSPQSSPVIINSFYQTSTVYGFLSDHANQVLGLGLNSTFLSTLYTHGFIASRSVGLYYGIPSSDLSVLRNGTLILGGYSTSRLLGNFSSQTYPIGTFTLPKTCPWEVNVSSVSIGSTTILSTPFTACIEPSELTLALPHSLYANYGTSLTSPTENLTVTLSNGLVVSIPSSLISTRSLSLSDNNSPILGAPFLSQVYLFADYQERQLYTALANHTNAYLVGKEEIQCVERANGTGDLGWAVGSAAWSTGTGTATGSGAQSTGTGKKSAGVRMGVNLRAVIGALGIGAGVCIW